MRWVGNSKLVALPLTKRAKHLRLIYATSLLLTSVCVITILYRNEITYINRSTFPTVTGVSHSKIISTTKILRERDNGNINISTITEEADNSARSGVHEELAVLLQCNDKAPMLDIHQQQLFWVLENYVIANRTFKCYESVTLTTQGDFTFLDNLVVLLEKWQGPVSVALYAPGDDFQLTLDSIAYLRNCHVNSLVKDLVTFHVAYDYNHQPNVINTSIANAYVDTWEDCGHVPYDVWTNKTYKQKQNLTYPINIVRNLARRTATTHFVFPSDIELYPSANFIEKFLAMILNNPNLIDNSPRVFVLPIFEINEDQIAPKTKTELQKMVKKKRAFIFHQRLCKACHVIPKFNDWMKKPESDTLNIFTSTKRVGSQKDWEPFYVGTNAEPWFDERLTWEGQQNKMIQGFIMCLMDYDYMVLDNAFLVHKPGIKKSKVQNEKYKSIVSATLRLIKKDITTQLINIYGRKKGCQWVPKTP